MQQVAFASGILACALIVAFVARSVVAPFYRLPLFTAEILARQPQAPRAVRVDAVALAVVRGLDGAILATGAIFVTPLGLYLLLTKTGIGIPIALTCIASGLFCAAALLFRVVQVWRALATGESLVVEVTAAQRRRARLYGSLWGDMSSGFAVGGSYRSSATGAEGSFYVQQQWAQGLRPGMAMWVVRLNGRDVLYAPSPPGALRAPTSPASGEVN